MAQDFIDLMGFARGAQLANDANWKNAFDDLKLQNMQTEAARSQQLYDMNLPLAQEKVTSQLEDIAANRDVAKFESSVLKAAAETDPAGRTGLWAAMLNQEIQSGGMNPAREKALRRLGERQLRTAVSSGDFQGAKVLASVLGSGYADKIDKIATWRNPANYNNPEAVAAAGGVLQPDGRVALANNPSIVMPSAAFAAMQYRMAVNSMFDPSKFVAEAENRNEAEKKARATVDQENKIFKEQGIARQAVLSPQGHISYVDVSRTAADGSSVTSVLPALPAMGREVDSLRARFPAPTISAAPAPAPAAPQAATTVPDLPPTTAGLSPHDAVGQRVAERIAAATQLQKFTPEVQALNPQGYVRAQKAFIAALEAEQQAALMLARRF